MKKKTMIFLLLFGSFIAVRSQDTFHGSFLMSFKTLAPINDNVPMLWNIESIAMGGKMALKIQDELISKGVSKRVVFNPADSTWTMLLSLNSIRQGTRVHRAAMFREAEEKRFSGVTITKEKRYISGYKCRKTIVESKNYTAELWITDKLKFDLCNIYKLLAHCGMVSEFMRQGDWYLWPGAKGMVLEVTSIKKESGDQYTMSVSDIKPGVVDDVAFDMKNFKISEIPEGQNCGVKIEEK